MPGPIVPAQGQPIADGGGRVTTPWQVFFNGLVRPPGPIVAVVVGVSPYTYTAASAGFLRVTGGTVSSIILTRNATTVSFGSTATVPVANGDTVTVIYGAVPTVSFIPA